MRALLVAALFAAAVLVLPAGGPISAGQDSRGLQITPARQLVPKGRDYALLFATDVYADRAWRPLRNPVRDATTIAAELQQSYGFTEARLVANPTLKQIFDTLDEYLSRRQFADNDQLLIFFAGHGLYRPELDLGFIVASDSRDAAADRANQSYFSFETLYRYVDRIRAKHIFLVLDVCHGGTFADAMAMRGNPARSDYDVAAPPERISRILTRTTRKYLTSGGNEYVPDGTGAHSPFAARFLEALRRRNADGIVTATDIYQVVRNVRPNEPVFGDFGRYEPVSDFVFVVSPALAGPSPPPPIVSNNPPLVSAGAGAASVGYVDLTAVRSAARVTDETALTAEDPLLVAALKSTGAGLVLGSDSFVLWADNALDLTASIGQRLRDRAVQSRPVSNALARFRFGVLDPQYLVANSRLGKSLTQKVQSAPAEQRAEAEKASLDAFTNAVLPLIARRAAATNLDLVVASRSVAGFIWASAEYDLTQRLLQDIDAAGGTPPVGAAASAPSSSRDFAWINVQRVAADSVLGKQFQSRVLALHSAIQKEVNALSGDAMARRVTAGEKELETLNSRLTLDFQAELLPVIESVARTEGRRLVVRGDVDGVAWANPNADLTKAVTAALDRSTAKRK